MSRPKSEATIQRERDRGVRKERREQKRAEHEAKQEARLKKKLVHESVERNGVPKINPDDSHFGLREALMYSPVVLCGKCGGVVRESAVIGSLCERCHYSMEVNDEKENELKAQENRAVPGKEDGRVKGTTALAGQLSLLI